tara:strand:- start:2334 stop:2717 length:384 start_codon:yes stop_codon:yes gene_type:complete
MAIQEYMTRQDEYMKMVFDLRIKFDGIEVKSSHLKVKDFLNVNSQIASSIDPLLSYNMHVNFAETILNGLKICGEINSVFNHKSFSNSLIKLQDTMKTSWKGYYTFKDNKDRFIFYAPNFCNTPLLD